MNLHRCLVLGVSAAALIAAARPTLPTVPAQAETAPAIDQSGDRADDPAIWRNPDYPARSLVISTDKKAGLAIHDLSGELLRFHPFGKLNNVDLRTGVSIAGRAGILVAASDRGDKKRPVLRLYRLDPATATLEPIGSVAMAAGEAYGLCLYGHGDKVDAVMVYEEGGVEQVALDLTGATPTGRSVHHFDLGSRSEGCVVDDRNGLLYVAEDKVAVWRFDLAAPERLPPARFAAVDGLQLHKDTEGLAILPRGTDGGVLFASSQGDNSYAAFRLPAGEFIGSFRIDGGPIDGTEDTDGIALDGGDFGPAWPGGLFVAQDGKNTDPDQKGTTKRAPQNFKLVPVEPILRALGEAAR